MTKYLETKRNSIEEAISSVVKGEGFASDAQRRAAFAQGYKAKGKKDKSEELDEGTLSLPKSMKDFRGIVNLMKRPIKAKDAERAISKFIDDDGIANGIISLKNKDPNADARPAIMRGFNRLKLYTKGEPSYLTTIKFNRKFEIQDKNIKRRLDSPPSEDRDNMGYVRMEGLKLDENGFVVGKVKMPKMKGGAKLQSKTNFDFRLFDPEDSPGSDKANDEMNREIV